MASGVRQLYIRLGMDTSGLRKGVSGASSMLGGLSKGAAIAGAAFAAMATKGVMAAAKFEQTRITFETLTGSVARGRKVIADLEKMAIKTPFENADIQQAGLTLLNFGLEVDKLIPTLGRLGDLSKGNAQDFQTLARVYGQARVEGKLMSKDIREFVTANIPIVKLLADQLGVAEDQIFDMASEGKVSFGVLEQAFKRATDEGGLFHGLMEKQSKSAMGLYSTFKDNLNIALKDLGNMLLPAVKVALENLIRLTNSFVGSLGEAAKNTDWPYKLAAGVQTAFDKMGDFFGQIYKGLGLLRGLVNMIQAVGNALQGIGAAAKGDFDKSGDFFTKSFGDLKEGRAAIADYGKAMGTILGTNTSRSFMEVYRDNMRTFDLYSATDKMSTSFDDAMAAVGDLALSGPRSSGSGSAKKKQGERVKRPDINVATLGNSLGFSDLTKDLQDQIISILDGVAQRTNAFGEIGSTAMEGLKGHIASVAPVLKTLDDQLAAMNARTESMVEFANRLGDGFVNAFDQIIAGGFKFGEFMKEMFLGVIKSAIKALVITIALNALTGGAKSIGDLLKGFGGNLGGILGLPKTASGGITNGPQTRIVGEAGREAIIPLNRGSSKQMLGGGGGNFQAIIRGRDLHIVAAMGQQDAARRGSPVIQFA